MPAATAAFLNAARKHMVDSQLRPNKVSDPRILQAMRFLPREAFLPPDRAALAYADENVPLAPGRVLLQPMMLARLIQAAEPASGETALVVGGGYTAALLAVLGLTVTALESAAPLLALARSGLAAVEPGVALVSGPLGSGWAAAAPYDLIVIDGAVPAVPAALTSQLNARSGRLLTILSGPGRTGRAIRIEAEGPPRPLFDCQAPEIPELAQTPAFAF